MKRGGLFLFTHTCIDRKSYLESCIEKHREHEQKLEVILRLLDNDTLSTDDVCPVYRLYDTWILFFLSQMGFLGVSDLCVCLFVAWCCMY